MKLNKKIMTAACSLLAVFFPLAGSAHPESEDVGKIFQSGDLEQILTTANAELQKNPDDEKLKKLTAEISKTIQREKMFAQESNPELLEKIAKTLRAFYYRHNLLKQAEKVDRTVYEKKPDNATALRLAETLLKEQKNREAADLLASRTLTEKDRTARLYAALAFAKLGEAEKAGKYLEQMSFDSYTPRELLIYALANASLGNAEAAAAGVKKILENAPAKETKKLREYFQGADFAKVSSNQAFQAALTTEGKPGNTCAGCPSRGTSSCGGGSCH